MPLTITLHVYLDTARPLSEPKWAKSGDVQEWLKSMFGRMFWVAGDAAEGWEKKIQVVDPDPVRYMLFFPSSRADALPIATNDLDSPRRLGSQLARRRAQRTTAILENAHVRDG